MLHNILIINKNNFYPQSYTQECNFYTALGCKFYTQTKRIFCKKKRAYVRTRACVSDGRMLQTSYCNHFLDVLVLKNSNGLLTSGRRCYLA